MVCTSRACGTRVAIRIYEDGSCLLYQHEVYGEDTGLGVQQKVAYLRSNPVNTGAVLSTMQGQGMGGHS